MDPCFSRTLLMTMHEAGFLDGNKWRTRRRLLTPAFHFRILEDFLGAINIQSTVLADKLGKMCQPGNRTDIVPLVTLCTLDIICETVMGISIWAQYDENSPYVTAVKRNAASTAGNVFCDLCSVVKGNGHHSKAVGNMDLSGISSENDLGELFNRRMLNPLFVSEFIFKRSCIGRELYKCLNAVHSFTRKGHDTTAMGISWALFLIGHHSSEQKYIHDELDAIFGDDKQRPVTSEDLKEMKYLECCLKEAQRLYPSVGFITRTCEEPFQIGDTTLPKGTVVRFSTYCLHRDEDVFPKPEEFHPERFFPENVKCRHPYAYVPFSAGPRNCIGQKFALAEEKIVVANILRRFKLKSLDQRDQIALVSELVLRPKNGLRVQFTAR